MFATIKSRYTLGREALLQVLVRADRFAKTHETALFWVLAILYKFALDAMYIWAASPQYAYGGLVYAPSFLKYCISTCMYLVLFALLPKREGEAVPFLLHLQFAYTVGPLLSFYALAGGSSRYILAVFLCMVMQTLLVRRKSGNERTIHIKGIQNYITVALGVLLLFTLATPILYNGFVGLKAFDFSYIYTMRENAVYPPGFGYLLNWFTKAILPFAVLYFIKSKRYWFALLAVVAQLLFYMETGHKVTLLMLAPILFVYILFQSGHLIKLMYGGLALLFLVISLGFQMDHVSPSLGLGGFLTSLVAVRAVFIPASIKFDFYNCFSQLPKVYFSDGMLGRLFSLTYPFAGSTGDVVFAFTGGAFGASEANTGYLGDSYAQMGFLGMFLMSLLLGAILRVLGKYDGRTCSAMLTALFTVYIIVLNDAALFTALLTGGMLIAFLLVIIYFGKDDREVAHGIQRL